MQRLSAPAVSDRGEEGGQNQDASWPDLRCEVSTVCLVFYGALWRGMGVGVGLLEAKDVKWRG